MQSWPPAPAGNVSPDSCLAAALCQKCNPQLFITHIISCAKKVHLWVYALLTIVNYKYKKRYLLPMYSYLKNSNTILRINQLNCHFLCIRLQRIIVPDLGWAFGLECTNFVSPPLQFPNRALFFGENPNLIFDRMMNRLHLFSFKRMVRVENMFHVSHSMWRFSFLFCHF